MFIQRAFQNYKDFKSATAAAASVAGAHPPAAPLPPLHPVAARHCGCLWSSQMRIQIQLQIQIQIRIQIRIRVWAQKAFSFHFISLHAVWIKGNSKRGRRGWAKKYASGRNLCQVTQPGLGDECWAIQVGVGVVALMVATFYVPFSVEHRMLSQIFNASQGRVKRGEGRRGRGNGLSVSVCNRDSTHAAGTHVLRIRKRKRKRHFAVNSSSSSSSPTQLTKCRPYLNCPLSPCPLSSCFPFLSLSISLSLPLLGVLCGTFHSIHLPFPVSIRFGRQLHNTKRVARAQRGGEGGAWVSGKVGVDPLMAQLATI